MKMMGGYMEGGKKWHSAPKIYIARTAIVADN